MKLTVLQVSHTVERLNLFQVYQIIQTPLLCLPVVIIEIAYEEFSRE